MESIPGDQRKVYKALISRALLDYAAKNSGDDLETEVDIFATEVGWIVVDFLFTKGISPSKIPGIAKHILQYSYNRTYVADARIRRTTHENLEDIKARSATGQELLQTIKQEIKRHG